MVRITDNIMYYLFFVTYSPSESPARFPKILSPFALKCPLNSGFIQSKLLFNSVDLRVNIIKSLFSARISSWALIICKSQESFVNHPTRMMQNLSMFKSFF